MSDSIRVLHVEDDADFSDLMETYLVRIDDRFEVESVTDADEGLKQLAEGAFDCIVSDFDMPGRNGIEFLEAVREEQPELPFILFTGKGSEEVASDAISRGVTDYIQKAAGTDQYAILANRVENAVEGYRGRQALAERNQELRIYERIFNSMQEGACLYDTDGRFEIVNRYLAEFYGTTPEALEGQSSNLTKLVDEAEPDEPFQAIVDGRRERFEGIVEGDFPGRGHTVLDVRLTPLSVDGTVEGVVGVARDVTQQQADERERQREHDRFRAVFEEAFDAMVIADDDGRYTAVNESAVELFGLPEEELLGRAIFEFAPEEFDFERAWQEFQASDADRGTFPLVRPDGSERLVEYAATADIVPGRHLSVLRDVTEREERERRLHEQTRQFQGVLDSVEAAIWIRDLDSRFQLANQNFRALFGIDDETELAGQRPADVLPQAVAEQFESNDRRVIEAGERIEFEEVVETVDGDRTYLTRIVPLYDDGEVFATCGVATDITDLKRSQRQLERVNDRLEEFVGIISHDLRNPLNVASGRLELARESGDDEHLAAVERAHDRMGSLIEDLLTLAREGERVSELEAVALADLMEACWATVETADATLVVETDRTVRADRSRLQQLLENLVRNAVEHAGPDATVTVGDLADGFFVADDGPGIPPDERDEVFDAGYTTSATGTGFGLNIVQQIADAHGWTVEVGEAADGGARFEIRGVEGAG